MLSSNIYNPENITSQDTEIAKKVLNNVQPEYSTLETLTAHLGNAIDLSTPAMIYRELQNNPRNMLARSILVDDGAFTDEELEEMTKGTMTEEEWKKSPNYREGLKFQPYYTDKIAQNLAEIHDRKQARSEVIAGSGLMANAVGFLGSIPIMALDPINRIPFTKVATGGKFVANTFGKKMIEGAIEAGVGTAIAIQVENAVDNQETTLKQDGLSILYGMAAGALFPVAGAIASKTFGAVKGKYKGINKEKITTPVEKEVMPVKEKQDIDITLEQAKKEFNTQSVEDKSVDIARNKVVLDALADGKEPNFENTGLKKSNEIIVNDNQYVSLPKEIYATGLGNKEISVEYEIRDLSDLLTSHQFDGYNSLKENPNYPQELQPRDRTRVASIKQIDTIADNIAPNKLILSSHDGEGAPIINASGIVESGNGRVLALLKAYDRGSADVYKKKLAEYGYDVNKFEKPVLVRVRKTELNDADLMKFVKGANESTTAVMSDTEKALSDSANVSDDLLLHYQGGEFDNIDNARFRNEFKKIIPQSELGNFINAEGELSRAGIKRMEAAVMYKAYEDIELVERLFEDIADYEMKTVQNTLKEISPLVAKLKSSVRQDITEPIADYSKNLIEAFNLVYHEKRNGGSVKMSLEVGRLFEAIDPRTEMIARSFFKNEFDAETYMSKENMTSMFKEFTRRSQEMEIIHNPLFEMSAPTKEDLLEIFDDVRRQYKDKIMPSAEVKSRSAMPAEANATVDKMEKAIKQEEIKQKEIPSEKENINKVETTQQEKIENEFMPQTEDEKIIFEDYKNTNEKINKVKTSVDDFISCVFSE